MGQSDLKHRLIAELKQVASELGRVPKRDEYRNHSKFGEKAYRNAFGGWTPFVMAAGLKVYAEKKDKKTIPNTDLLTIISPDSPQKPRHPAHGIKAKILVIGDTHFPFVDQEALSGVYVYAAENPDITHIVQIGDLFDCYAFASFPKSMMEFTPKQELDLAREMAGSMWARLQKLCPKAECHQILGNHSTRPIKRLLEQSPELEVFFDYLKHWEFEGVRLHKDARQPLVIGDVYFMHGYLSKLGDHAKKHGVNVVCGHTHRGGVLPLRLADGRTVYEMNAGYLGDPFSKALSYTATRLIEWTHGFGVIDHLGARFISL